MVKSGWHSFVLRYRCSAGETLILRLSSLTETETATYDRKEHMIRYHLRYSKYVDRPPVGNPDGRSRGYPASARLNPV